MIALYVVSSESAAGKTAICAGLGSYFQGSGRKVGFLRSRLDGADQSDAAFMKQVLSLTEDVESLCPSATDASSLASKVKEAHARVAQGKDVVIVEGALGQSPDDGQSKAAYEIAGAIGAKVLVIDTYPGKSSLADISKGFGKNMLGVVLNKVPKSQLKRAQDEISAQLDKAGVNILGVLPEDRALLALTIGELADSIKGKILNSAEKSVELVENFMLGALVVDSGLDYFGRKDNKAAVIRGDRPDMQMAALETSTKCLVLSGTAEQPFRSVLEKAEKRGIPIIQAESDADSIIVTIEDALDKTRFNQDKKLPLIAEIVREHLNLQTLERELGLAG